MLGSRGRGFFVVCAKAELSDIVTRFGKFVLALEKLGHSIYR